jgi:hypothetical protein
MIVIGILATMPQTTLYRYPFDEGGREMLTLGESLAAMQELEYQINRLCAFDWRWCDLSLSVVERHPMYVIYEIHHREAYTGRAIVMPSVWRTEMNDLRVALSDRALQVKILARIRSRATR